MADEVLYEEADGIAIVAINRPGKKNTLTENVVRGIADGVDAATRSKEVAAVVLRGVGDTFTAGYDLTDGGEWDVPYGAPDVETREGAWDPVRDLAFMGSNVKRFMRIRECPKPVLGEIRGWAIGGRPTSRFAATSCTWRAMRTSATPRAVSTARRRRCSGSTGSASSTPSSSC